MWQNGIIFATAAVDALRAPTAGVVNVLNVKYLAHLPHQTQK